MLLKRRHITLIHQKEEFYLLRFNATQAVYSKKVSPKFEQSSTRVKAKH